MPQVGNKHFSYTKKGQMAAKKASVSSGMPVKNKKKKKKSMMSSY